MGVLISTVISWAIALGALAALIQFIVGGFRYITAGGDAESVTKARATITNAIVGLLILSLAFSIFRFLVDLLNLNPLFPGLN